MICHLELLEERSVPGPLHNTKQSLVSHFTHDTECIQAVVFASIGLFSLQAGQDLGTQLTLILLTLQDLA